MELLPLLRLIWQRRLALAAGFVVAVALAVAIGMPAGGSSVLAWTTLNLDTPKSQLVNSAPSGADTLPWRASLLVHLMTTDETQRQLAQQLGVRPDQVNVVDPAYALPEVPASMPLRAAKAAGVTVAPYVLTVQLDNLYLPLISIQAAAPDGAGARRLAAAAVAVLESRSSVSEAPYSSKILTGGGTALKPQQFVVQQVAPIRAKPVPAKVMPVKPIAAFVFVFGLWAAAALLLPGRWRRRRPRVAPAL
jgi:hypothetical protein